MFSFDLAVVGLGYVGLPLVVEASDAGMRVLGLDVNQTVVDGLNGGRSHIGDVAGWRIHSARRTGFVATTESERLSDAAAVSICVPTPWRDRQPDMSYVTSAAEAVGRSLVAGQLVILESTTYPGTTDEVVIPILEAESGLRAGADFLVAYSPERIDPANAVWGLHNTPKLLAGIDGPSTQAAKAVYEQFCGEIVVLSGTREAEMAKLLENTYRHVNIALVNEIAMICHDLGIDVWEVVRGAATKPFGFQSFRPGPGIGGHCIPVDPRYLAYRVHQDGKPVRTIESAQAVNAEMILHVVTRAIELLRAGGASIEGADVVLAGVSYKPNVGDVRETPARHIASLLKSMGAEVTYLDPHVETFVVDGEPMIRRLDETEVAENADLVLLLAAHSAFDVDTLVRKARVLFDTSGTADPDFAFRL